MALFMTFLLGSNLIIPYSRKATINICTQTQVPKKYHAFITYLTHFKDHLQF